MAENDAITSEHMEMIWAAAMTMACDEDTAEEVLAALVRSLPVLLTLSCLSLSSLLLPAF